VLEDYMNLFEMYPSEILAGVAILVLLIVYYILKKVYKNKKNDSNTQEITSIIEKDNATIEKTIPKDTLKVTDTIPVVTEAKPKPKLDTVTEVEKQESKLSGDEEGSFGIKEAPKQKTPKTKRANTPLSRIKRAIPPHEKIKKEDFKEFAGQRILVAEDNLINQKVIGGLLADSGIEITIADDGQDALDILEKDNNFNIILMDAHMPRVDGFEATRIIRQTSAYNHIVVVALSGDTAADDIKKMTESGMEEHLEKPLRMDALYDVLYAYTKNRKSDADITDESYVDSMITKEIDTEKGLNICGYDEEFYNEILTEFIATYSKSHVVIRDLLNNRQLKEADKYLLDISGTTSNIGATNISEIALSLKNAISNPKERRYVGFYKQYVLSLQNLLKDIKEYQS